jgi:hypothetical protein
MSWWVLWKLRHPKWFDRYKLIDALEERRDVPALIEVVQDAGIEGYARAQAAGALAKVGGPAAVPVLERALQDEESYLRETALRGLSSLKTPEAVQILLRHLNQPGKFTLWEVGLRLYECGDPGARSALIQKMLTGSFHERGEIVRALEHEKWMPSTPLERAQFAISKKDYKGVASEGLDAIPVLLAAVRTGDLDHCTESRALLRKLLEKTPGGFGQEDLEFLGSLDNKNASGIRTVSHPDPRCVMDIEESYSEMVSFDEIRQSARQELARRKKRFPT